MSGFIIRVCLLGLLMTVPIMLFAEDRLFTDAFFEVDSYSEKELLDQNIIREEQQPHLIRNRYVEVNLEMLRDEETLLANLFHNVQLNITITRKVNRGEADFSLFGRVVDDALSSVNIVVKDGKVTGDIHYKDTKFQIRWMGGKTHSISEIDRRLIPPGGPPLSGEEIEPSKNLSPSSEINAPATSTDDGSSIDVLVLYTQAAAAGGSIASEIQLAVDYMNLVLTNTQVSLTMRLVGTHMVDYGETGIALTDLNRLSREDDGFMDEVFYLRDYYGADLVALVTESMNNWAGLGMMNSSSPHEDVAYHVSVRPYLTETFAHEVGHNLGMAHEVYISPTGGAYPYSHGYVDTTNRFSTVMAYGTKCYELGFYCTRIPYYSANTGAVLYNGNAVGDASADNRQTVINTKLAISRFRQSKSTSTLSSLGASEKGCFIATAAYGSFLDPHVSALRLFRDRYLEPYAWGRVVMDFYYSHSPPLAEVIEQNRSLRIITRWLLAPLVYFIIYPIYSLTLLLASGLLVYFLELRRRGMK